MPRSRHAGQGRRGKDPERFYCPWPGCKRSFAELWRLKVHHRAPPHIRGSGRERGHNVELTHCSRCHEQLVAGRVHACYSHSGGLGSPSTSSTAPPPSLDRESTSSKRPRTPGGPAAAQRLESSTFDISLPDRATLSAELLLSSEAELEGQQQGSLKRSRSDWLDHFQEMQEIAHMRREKNCQRGSQPVEPVQQATGLHKTLANLQVHRSPSTSSAEMHVDGAQSSQSTSTSEDLGREAIRQGSMQGSPSISTAQPVSRPPYTSYAASTHACRLTAMLPSSSNSFSFMWSGLPEWHAWQGRVDGQTADPQALYEMPSGCTDAVTGANLRAGLHQQIRHCLLEDVPDWTRLESMSNCLPAGVAHEMLRWPSTPGPDPLREQ